MRRADERVVLVRIRCGASPCAQARPSAQALDQFIGFGDSTMDSGYFRYGPTGGSPGLPPGAPSDTIDRLIAATVAAGGSGAFLGPGVVDTVQLAAKFGLSALPSTYPGGGGTNYANGSAQTVPTTADDGYSHGLYNNVPIVTQIYNYLSGGPQRRQSERAVHDQLRRQRPDLAAEPGAVRRWHRCPTSSRWQPR